MAFETKKLLEPCVLLEDPATEPTCQKCLATVRFIRSIPDPATGRSVRIFECDDCGQRTWDE